MPLQAGAITTLWQQRAAASCLGAFPAHTALPQEPTHPRLRRPRLGCRLQHRHSNVLADLHGLQGGSSLHAAQR